MIQLTSAVYNKLFTGRIEDLRDSLQTALRVEHATIPPYLYTLYSLGTDPANKVVADIIHSVVIEEMLHMTLVANILNAVGGRPVIADPHFPISYPGPLPGGVESGLQVTLAPFSTQHVKSVFMEIETPENPENFPVKKTRGLAVAAKPVTIGAFYTGVKEAIKELGEGIFTGDPARQVEQPFKKTISDVESACAAIDLIIDQGEGTGQSDPTAESVQNKKELAHYYRFASIVHGRELIADPTEPKGYSYSGPDVVAKGAIAAVPTNPKAAHYTLGTAERHAMDNFNYTYTALLRGLDQLYNGQPDTFLRTLGAMFSVREQALDMMAGTNLHGPIGPSFEYLPTLPAK